MRGGLGVPLLPNPNYHEAKVNPLYNELPSVIKLILFGRASTEKISDGVYKSHLHSPIIKGPSTAVPYLHF